MTEVSNFDEEGATVEFSIKESAVTDKAGRHSSKSRGYSGEYRRKQLIDDMLRYMESKAEAEKFVDLYFDVVSDTMCKGRTDFLRIGDTNIKDSIPKLVSTLLDRGMIPKHRRRISFKMHSWVRRNIRGYNGLKHDRKDRRRQ